jgi:uncharacterized protein involved in response to NO
MAKRARAARPAPFAGAHPTTLLLRLSVLLGATAGFSLGLTLLGALALGRTADLPWAALVQVHGQVQLIGFVGLFVLGTAAQLLPGFLARPLVHRGQVQWGGTLIAVALLLRAVAQPLEPSLLRAAALWLAAGGELGGVGLCLYSYAALVRHTLQPPELWRHLALVGFACLGLSVLLNLAATAALVGGPMLVPEPLDDALVQLELNGFVGFVVLGVSRKLLPRFLLLSPPRDGWLRAGAGAYLAGVLLVSGGDLLGGLPATVALGRGGVIAGAGAQLVGVLLFVVGLNLYRSPTRPSGAPQVTEPARRWVRFAYGWLVLASLLAAGWATRALLGGSLANFFEETATRHAFAQGFVLTILIALGSRILPGYAAWAIRHPWWVEATIAAVTSGAALRVAGELATAGGVPLGETVAGGGGALGVLGFAVFAVALLSTVGRPAGGV